MSRLSRFTQLIFGSQAGTDELAEFGSLAASTPALYNGTTITPAIVQTLANYLEGWFGAVVGQNSPAIEDMNSLCYLFAYQLAYLMQAGVSEWDAGTTYYTGSVAQSGDGTLYKSLTDTNLNNAPTDGSNWTSPILPGVATPDTLPYLAGMSVPANESMIWPNLQIGNGQTVVAPSNSNLIGITKIVVSGSGILQATGTGVIRII